MKCFPNIPVKQHISVPLQFVLIEIINSHSYNSFFFLSSNINPSLKLESHAR